MFRVLLADDEEIIRNSISKMIPWEALDCQLIGAASNGMDAFHMICDYYPDIVITDIKMPILNGLELIEKALCLDKDISFILLSGYSDFSFAQKAMKYGVRYYHLKPTKKEDIIDSLVKITEEIRSRGENKKEQKIQFLKNLQYPMQKSFMMEALNNMEQLEQICQRYSQFFISPAGNITLCICSFLEEAQLNKFTRDIHMFFRRHHMTLVFNMVYVKNNILFVLQLNDLAKEDAIIEYVQAMDYPDQAVIYEVHFYHFSSMFELLSLLLQKISRYGRILIIDNNGIPDEIKNNLTSPKRMETMEAAIIAAKNDAEIVKILKNTFLPITNYLTSQIIAINLLSQLQMKKDMVFLNPQNVKKLHDCKTPGEILEVTGSIILQQLNDGKNITEYESPVQKLKAYVENHLDSESISLKWLAENLLFVSVGYLSKLFIKEEGIRFSEYLNQKRMERAQELMRVYHQNNIQDIAQKVGFGNNPRYFGQVFKKYIGVTPSEYMGRDNKIDL